MAEKESVKHKKSVKDFQNETRAKEQEMQKYGKDFNTTVRGLENDWKKHGKQLKEAATKMLNQGINKMKEKVRGFNNEISNQKKENKAAISRMKGDVGLFVSEINEKRKDFESYTKGPFAGYIKAFWG